MAKHGVCSDCHGLGHGFPHSQGVVTGSDNSKTFPLNLFFIRC